MAAFRLTGTWSAGTPFQMDMTNPNDAPGAHSQPNEQGAAIVPDPNGKGGTALALPVGGFEKCNLTGWIASVIGDSTISVTSLFPQQGRCAARMTAVPRTAATLRSQAMTYTLPSATTVQVGFSLLGYLDYRQAQTFTLYATFLDLLGNETGRITLPVVSNWGLDQYTAYSASTVLTSSTALLALYFELDCSGSQQGTSVMLADVSAQNR